MKKRIGILGGSFDPAHKGHIKISQEAKKRFNLKNVFWVVTKKNPFKKKSFYSLSRRISLAKKLSIKNKFIKVIFVENKCKSNRAYKYIKYLSRKHINDDFYFIIGADNLINFHKWKSWKKIIKISTLVVYPRNKFQKKAKKSMISRYLNNKNIIFIKSKKIDISSSKLRKNYLKLLS